MQTKKFWCHYIGNDGNTPKRRSIELTDIHELLPNVSNDGAKTPLWYEKKEDDYRQVYYELYAQLSDTVAVNIIHMNLRPYAVERLLQSDEDIVSRHEKRLENFLAEYPKLSEERKKQDRENCEHQIAADKHERDRNMIRLKALLDYSNLLLTGTIWVCSATVRAYKEAGSGYYPLLEILRNENLAEREREEQERREEDRRRAEEEARKKAEERAAEDRKLQRLTELGMLPDKLTAMQRGTVLAALEERSCFKVSGGKYVSCTVYELIADHGFTRMGKTTEKYNRYGDPLSKPRNTYHVFNDADDTITWCYQINGRMGALMIEGKYNNQNK